MNSMNVPAIKTMEKVGVERAVAYAQQLGIRTLCNEEPDPHDPRKNRRVALRREPGTALGASDVTPWELTSVYAVFNRGGLRPEPVFIKRITDRDGRVYEENSDPNDPWQTREQRTVAMLSTLDRTPERVMDAPDAFIINYLLTQVAKFGTAARASQIGRQVAGKTGTTNDGFDTWFVGYTPTLVTGVWVGFDKKEFPLGAREQGGRTSLPIWMDYQKRALKGVDEPSWAVPEGICHLNVHKETGRRVSADDRNAILVPFKCGTEPKLDEGGVTPESFRNEEL